MEASVSWGSTAFSHERGATEGDSRKTAAWKRLTSLQGSPALVPSQSSWMPRGAYVCGHEWDMEAGRFRHTNAACCLSPVTVAEAMKHCQAANALSPKKIAWAARGMDRIVVYPSARRVAEWSFRGSP
jgi:hypothetical protein